VGEEEVTQRIGSTLERNGELVLVHGAQQRLDGARVKAAKVFEGDHQRLDAVGGLTRALFQRGEEATFRLAVEIVENFRHKLVAVAAIGARQVRHEFGAKRLLDLVENFLLHGFHAEHAGYDFKREIFWQMSENAGRVLGPDFRQHYGDRLRIFILQIARENGFVHIAELFPHGATGRATNFIHDRVDAIFGEEAEQEALG